MWKVEDPMSSVKDYASKKSNPCPLHALQYSIGCSSCFISWYSTHCSSQHVLPAVQTGHWREDVALFCGDAQLWGCLEGAVIADTRAEGPQLPLAHCTLPPTLLGTCTNVWASPHWGPTCHKVDTFTDFFPYLKLYVNFVLVLPDCPRNQSLLTGHITVQEVVHCLTHVLQDWLVEQEEGTSSTGNDSHHLWYWETRCQLLPRLLASAEHWQINSWKPKQLTWMSALFKTGARLVRTCLDAIKCVHLTCNVCKVIRKC